MKTKIRASLPLLLAATMIAAACDTIDPSEYTLASGQTAFAEGAHVYVEKYTGPRCTNCPAADRTLDALHSTLGDRLVCVSVNTSDESFGTPLLSSDPDMRTPEGAEWERRWGVEAWPTAFVNRMPTAYTAGMNNIGGALNAALLQKPKIQAQLKAEAEGGRLSVDVDLRPEDDAPQEVQMSLLLTEDSLVYAQIDGSQRNREYVHNHMLRCALGGTWGETLRCTPSEAQQLHRSFPLDRDDLTLRNCHIVLLLSDSESGRVLNSMQCNIESHE